MSNTIQVTQKMARASAAILKEKFPLFTQFSREGEGEFGQVTNFSNTGDTIRIRVPALSAVGSTADITSLSGDVTEGSVNLTLNILKNTRQSLTSKELTYDANEFQKTNFGQGVAQVGEGVQNAMFGILDGKVANTVVTTSDSSTDWLYARSKLTRGIAPMMGRSGVVEPNASVRLSNDLFNQMTTSKDEVITEGFLGKVFGADFFEVASGGVVVNGSKTASVTISGSHAGYAGGGTIKLGGLTSGDTFKKGQVFTIAGVHGVNPLSGASTGVLRDFVITADATATGATLEISVFPELKVGVAGYINALPAASAALTFVGAAGETLTNSYLFHKDAARVAFGVLETHNAGKGYSLKADGFGVRVQMGSDILTDVNTTRVDVLAGIAVLRPDWICKVTKVTA